MKYEHGDEELFGTYWSDHGPIRITLENWVYDENGPYGPSWVMKHSPRGVDIIKETIRQH